jgi:hypothetical protein
MNTRRSPRNQDRLWKALDGTVATFKPAPLLPSRCWDCISFPDWIRGRGFCVTTGAVVNGRTTNRPCFSPRGSSICDTSF